MRIAIYSILIALMALPVFAAGPERVSDKAAFLSLLQGRSLTYLGVKLTVTPDGRILGRALGRDVAGTWAWQGGYFCREGQWGKRAIPMNCQEVVVSGNEMRFTSDRGTGESARFYIK